MNLDIDDRYRDLLLPPDGTCTRTHYQESLRMAQNSGFARHIPPKTIFWSGDLPAAICSGTKPIMCGCVVWTGPTNGGYGTTTFRGKRVPAHQRVYEALVGPVPDGKVLDHLCACKPCVRIAHLELVSFRENSRRGSRPLAGAPQCRQIHVGDFRKRRY